MPIDVFISVISIFVLSCGGVLIFAAWPLHSFRPTQLELLALSLGGIMVLVSGYGLAMVTMA